VLDKCEEAETVYRRYASFLHEIQKDTPLASSMIEFADALHARAVTGESKSQASSSHASTKAERKRQLYRPLAVSYDRGLVWLKMKLRVASVIVAAVVIALFVCECPPSREARRPACLFA
jgi:hypothetical protein